MITIELMDVRSDVLKYLEFRLIQMICHSKLQNTTQNVTWCDKSFTTEKQMKDQYTIEDNESKQEKWNRGLDLFIESVLKPDPALRQCAHNQRCYHELMDVRSDVLNYLKSKRWH